MNNSSTPTFTPPPDYIMFDRIAEKLKCKKDDLFNWICDGYFGRYIFFTTYQNRSTPYELNDDEMMRMANFRTTLLQQEKSFSEFKIKASEKTPIERIEQTTFIKLENLTIKTDSLNNFISRYNIDETNSNLHLICEIFKFLHLEQNINLPPELFIAQDLWKKIYITEEITLPTTGSSISIQDIILNDCNYCGMLGGRNTRSDTRGRSTAAKRIARILNSTVCSD